MLILDLCPSTRKPSLPSKIEKRGSKVRRALRRKSMRGSRQINYTRIGNTKNRFERERERERERENWF